MVWASILREFLFWSTSFKMTVCWRIDLCNFAHTIQIFAQNGPMAMVLTLTTAWDHSPTEQSALGAFTHD